MQNYANGGVVGWGTICGGLNGALAVMGILGVHGKLGNALMDYYCTTELPTSDWDGVELVTSVSYSPLCHISVSKWAAAQGVTVTDPLKEERCARLVGDMVFKAVELMNAYFLEGTTPPAWVPPESYKGCYDCHTSGIIPSQQGKMDCLDCHMTRPAHGWRRKGKGKMAAVDTEAGIRAP